VTPRCHCGQPLHYQHEATQQLVERLIADQGAYVPMTCEGRTWLVQRHYLALHGVVGHELPYLGFKEVVAH
jgi:hypothetical protein